MSDENRDGYQGALESELTEKIRTGLTHAKQEQQPTLASDIFDIIALAMHNSDKPKEEVWELINSRAGQYLNAYVPEGKVFPDHIMKELELIRAPVEYQRQG